jgi:hypothetical protein
MEEEVAEMSLASYFFSIRTLADDKLIGELGLEVVNWAGRDAFVGLGIGETEYWSKGYGTDVMNVLLHFAFRELNLRRVSLSVFEYNPRAIRSYEKAGFRHEGHVRKALNREGRRWDAVYMGILREEWMEKMDTKLQINGTLLDPERRSCAARWADLKPVTRPSSMFVQPTAIQRCGHAEGARANLRASIWRKTPG